MNRQYCRLFDSLETTNRKGKVGLFCNQVSYDFSEKKYLFQLLAKWAESLKVLVPEHGFFAELQDQELVEKISPYRTFEKSTSFISIYNNSPNRVGDLHEILKDMDLLIIDIQDVGSRYFTYLTTIGILFKIIRDFNLDLSIILIDRPNPAGRQVEGTCLPKDFRSFIGWEGIPHRYGLTIGELCLFLNDQIGGNLNLEVIKFNDEDSYSSIYPSPNIPHPITPQVYSGQCLLEGANLSEGRGTTRPFEIFGAPYLKILFESWVEDWNINNQEAILRPMLFKPTFHKYQGEKCWGFQLHPGENYHSLFFSIKLLKAIKEKCIEFNWREGPYEAGSDRTAIELLAGDETILSFLNGECSIQNLVDKFSKIEAAWIKQVQPFLLYPEPVYSIL